MEKLGLRDRNHFSQEYLARAMANGFIEMTNPRKTQQPFAEIRKIGRGFSEAVWQDPRDVQENLLSVIWFSGYDALELS